MPVTHDICERAGTYRSKCWCSSVIKIKRGELFPPCAVCGRYVEWEPHAHSPD